MAKDENMILNFIKSMMGTIKPVDIDNNVGNIDIVGSWMELGFVVVALVAGIIFSWPLLKLALKTKKKYTPTHLSNQYFQHHGRVHELLTELRVELDCARTQIIQFHNGGNFFDGNPMAKLTMTHESVRNGVSPESKNWRDLQMPLLIQLLEQAKENNPKLYITNAEVDCYSSQQLIGGNVLSYSILPLYQSNRFVGFVTSQWCAWNKVDLIFDSVVFDKMESIRDLLQFELDKEGRA